MLFSYLLVFLKTILFSNEQNFFFFLFIYFNNCFFIFSLICAEAKAAAVGSADVDGDTRSRKRTSNVLVRMTTGTQPLQEVSLVLPRVRSECMRVRA